MKRFNIFAGILAVFAIVALFSLAGPRAFADCFATDAQMVPVASARSKAVAARDAGDLDGAALLYQQAAEQHPKIACAVSYKMNAVGCLLGTWDVAKGYRWDDKRGTKNAQAAYKLLKEVQDGINEARATACKCTGSSLSGVQTWHDRQLAWLQKIVPEAAQ